MNKYNPLIWITVAMLSGCANFPGGKADKEEVFWSGETTAKSLAIIDEKVSNPVVPTDVASIKRFKGGLYQGTGSFVNDAAATPKSRKKTKGDVVLNFEDADIRVVIKTILSDVLGENYTIDPAVKGTITVQTQKALTKNSVLPTLETILRLNNVVLVREGGYYKALPAKVALKSAITPKLATAKMKGFGTRVFPLQYVATTEMKKILGPLLPDENAVKAIDGQNLLIATGTGPELTRIAETIDIFDVDWLAGMSVGLFPIETTDAKAIAKELEQIIIGDNSPIKGMVKLIPVERLNSIMVMSPQADYLKQIEKWIKRLDQAQGEAGQKLYVYYVQNGKAADLATILNGIIGSNKSSSDVKLKLSPREKAVTLKSSSSTKPSKKLSRTDSGIEFGSTDKIKIIADEVNNALLIMADPHGYKMIANALGKLDITPLQVLIEFSLVNVTLNDSLEHGVEWFLRGQHGRLGDEVRFTSTNSLTNGFSYKLFNGTDPRAFLKALESVTDTKVLSNPSLLVLNNYTAEMNVGQEVPVLTQQQQSTNTTSTTTASAPIVNSIQYKDIGILLTVTPRVNTGGLVIMEISQEDSSISSTKIQGLDTPVFEKRKIKSNIAVQSGQTIILGGLIKKEKSATESGIPILRNIPILGHLFKDNKNSDVRNELLVMITPIVINNVNKANQVTDEYKSRMKKVNLVRDDIL